MLDAGQGKQVSQLGGVDHVGSLDRDRSGARGPLEGHGLDPVTMATGRHRPMVQQHLQASSGPVRGQECLQDRLADPRFVAQGGDESIPGIQAGIPPGMGGQGVVSPVVLPDLVAEKSIAASASE